MKIMCIGDVVSSIGRDMLFKYVDDLKYQKNIDLCIANGENASHGHGMSRSSYIDMCRAGVDGFTMGNHVWDSKEIIDLLKNEENIIRPINLHHDCPGEGSMILVSKTGIKVGIINAMGRVYMNPPVDSPFDIIKEKVEYLKTKTNIIIIDFHAEATSEKRAMGFFLDGKVSAVFGTHTHTQTSDETILPNGTGYITDLGMTGASISILGMDPEIIVKRFVTGMPQKFELAKSRGQFNACIFDINDENGKCVNVERVFICE